MDAESIDRAIREAFLNSSETRLQTSEIYDYFEQVFPIEFIDINKKLAMKRKIRHELGTKAYYTSEKVDRSLQQSRLIWSFNSKLFQKNDSYGHFMASQQTSNKSHQNKVPFPQFQDNATRPLKSIEIPVCFRNQINLNEQVSNLQNTILELQTRNLQQTHTIEQQNQKIFEQQNQISELNLLYQYYLNQNDGDQKEHEYFEIEFNEKEKPEWRHFLLIPKKNKFQILDLTEVDNNISQSDDIDNSELINVEICSDNRSDSTEEMIKNKSQKPTKNPHTDENDSGTKNNRLIFKYDQNSSVMT